VDRGTIDTDESTTLLRMGDCSGSLNKLNIVSISTLEDSGPAGTTCLLFAECLNGLDLRCHFLKAEQERTTTL